MSTSTLLPDELRKHHVLSLIGLVCVASIFFLGTPGFVVLMATQWGLSESQLGMIATADSVGNAIGSLLMTFVLYRYNPRSLVFIALLGFIAANALSAFRLDDSAMLATRLASGVFSGVMAGLAIRRLSEGSNAERNLTWMVISQTLAIAVLLTFVLPWVAELGQATAAFTMVAIFGVIGLLVRKLFPEVHLQPEAEPGIAAAGETRAIPAYISLLSIFLLYVSVGVVWTFIGYLGHAAGFEPTFVETLLGGANLLSIAAISIVPLMIKRDRLFSTGIVALILCTAAAIGLSLPPQASIYAVSTVVFICAWGTSITLLLALLPTYDKAGRLIMLAPGVLCMGSALGSFLGGQLMEVQNTAMAFQIAAACCGVAGVFVLGLGATHKR
nr:MFS transporter [uncultured Rhodoferax sp.]